MGKIISFNNPNEIDRIEGYTYFAKAVLDSLCELEDVPEDIPISVQDQFGKIHKIQGALLTDGEVLLQI